VDYRSLFMLAIFETNGSKMVAETKKEEMVKTITP